MIIDCPTCGATYSVSDEKVRGRRVRVRCKGCNTGIVVDGRQLAPEPEPEPEQSHEDLTRQLSPEDATRQYQHPHAPLTFDEDEATKVMTASMAANMRTARSAPRATPPPPRAPATRPPPAPTPPPPTPAPEPSTEWTVNVGEADHQTFGLAALVQAYNAGLVPDDAFVWREGMADWLPLLEVPEIRTAIEAESATQVLDARVFARAAPEAPTPAADYAAPTPPPRAYSPPAPISRPGPPIALTTPARAPGRAATRAAARPAPTDLFGGVDAAGSEAELLASASEPPLGRYQERPTGARNESSVLFSLNALKAGATSSAPPAPVRAAPPTAADFLGMPSGGGGVSLGTGALLSAPVEPPAAPPVRPAVSAMPPPSPMEVEVQARDTTPPVARRGRSPVIMLLLGVVLAAAAFGAVWFFVLRPRMLASSSTAGSETATHGAKIEPARGMPEPTPERAPAAAPEESEPAAPRESEPEQKPEPAPEAPEAPEASELPQPQAAPAPKGPAAAKPEPEQPATATPEPDKSKEPVSDALKAAISGKDIPKVVLEEEESPSGAEGEEDPKAAPTKPPFDTGAAKAALSAAAASAASCKQPDGPTGAGKVQVTFAQSGRATNATIVSGPFSGTPVGGCVAKAFRQASVPAFEGDPVTVSKSFSIPD